MSAKSVLSWLRSENRSMSEEGSALGRPISDAEALKNHHGKPATIQSVPVPDPILSDKFAEAVAYAIHLHREHPRKGTTITPETGERSRGRTRAGTPDKGTWYRTAQCRLRLRQALTMLRHCTTCRSEPFDDRIEQRGSTLSVPPGGMLDKGVFHCLGLWTVFTGKNVYSNYCELVFAGGDKILATFTPGPDGTSIRDTVVGTGKYEGLALSGKVMQLGPYPVVKPGAFQNCNRQTGTYKIK
jgi:hypothetical protein